MNNFLKVLLILLLLGAVGYAVYGILLVDQGAEPPVAVEPAETDAPRPDEARAPAPPIGDAKPAAISTQRVAEEGTGGEGAVVDVGTGTGAISGRVVDETGRGLEGVLVSLLIGESDPTLTLLAGRQETGRSIRTDADGAFHLPDVPARSDYIVQARHAGYAQTESAGVQVRDNDIRLVPDIVLGSGITVSGTVADDRGATLLGVDVRLFDTSQIPGLMQRGLERKPWAETKTDAAGKYLFANVHFGGIQVEAEADGYALVSRTAPTQLFTKPTDQVMDFVLSKAMTMRGVVVDPAGRPIAGATIDGFQVGGDPMKGMCRARATSEDDGRFELTNVVDGQYVLRARATDHSELNNVQAVAGANDLRLVLEPQGAIAGFVRDARSNQPVTDFRLQLKVQGPDGAYIERPQAIDVKAADGAFLFTGLDPGNYVLKASAENFAPSDSKPVFVERGKTVTNAEILLDEGGTIRGVVVGPGGPVAGAQVKLNRDEFVELSILKLFGNAAASGPIATARTNGSGEFELAYLEAGTFQIAIRKENFAPFTMNGVTVERRQVNQLGSLRLSAGGAIAGRCVDAGGRPYSTGSVTCTNQVGETRTVRPDLDGRFEIANLPADKYRLSLRPERIEGDQGANVFTMMMLGRGSEQEVTVQEGVTAKVTLALPATP